MSKDNGKIEGLSNVQNAVVQKTRPLLALWQSDLTLAEFKILDIYLGRINSRDPEHRTVVFKRGELEKLIGSARIDLKTLDTRLAHLMTTIRIQDPEDENEFKRVALFEEADAKRDKYGVWQVELTCTEPAQKYIFNIENIKYIRYKLKFIVNMTSKYTYLMFLYLWDNKFRGTWKIKLDELKRRLRCSDESVYSEFRYFNVKILKKVKEEIEEVTDLRYDYTTVKEGRTVVAIQFTIKSDPEKEEINCVDDQPIDAKEEKQNWKDRLRILKISEERIGELETLLTMVPKVLLSPDLSDEEGRHLYMDQKLAAMERVEADKRVEGGRIRSRFFYLKSLITKDIEGARPQQSNYVPKGTQAFRNFTERNNNNYMDKILAQYKQGPTTEGNSKNNK